MTFILVVRKIDMFDRSGFHLTEFMSRNCFEAILTALSYVDHDPPRESKLDTQQKYICTFQ